MCNGHTSALPVVRFARHCFPPQRPSDSSTTTHKRLRYPMSTDRHLRCRVRGMLMITTAVSRHGISQLLMGRGRAVAWALWREARPCEAHHQRFRGVAVTHLDSAPIGDVSFISRKLQNDKILPIGAESRCVTAISRHHRWWSSKGIASPHNAQATARPRPTNG